MNDIPPQTPETNTTPEDKAEKITKDLQLKLPGSGLPILIRLIALFTLIGGLGIMESVFVDIVRPATAAPFFYIFRIIVGILALLIAYEIVVKNRMAIWLYAIVVIIGLIINPIVAILPLILLIYLFTQRNYLQSSVLDKMFESLKNKFKKEPDSEV